MSARGQEFKGLFPPQEKKPTPNFAKGSGIELTYIRDNFTILTWLCFGAFAQTTLFILADRFGLGRVSLIPAIAILVYKTLDAYLMSIGWKKNIYMDGVIQKKFSTAFVNASGSHGSKPADSEVVVFLIGTRCNHALGMFAPGVQDLLDYFPKMVKDLDDHRDEYGFLGMTSWMNSADRSTNSEIMQVCYFKSYEGLHKFAHAPTHRKGWDWWNRTFKQHPHLSIYHETYVVPKGHWESIYVNSHVSGINSSFSTYTDEMTGQKMWSTPMVDASKGLLKTSAGRMSRSNATEHDAYGTDPYQNQ